jgi:tRNA(adenine34) deaminase
MKAALMEARRAARKGEVPIGTVLVKDGKIISRGHNLTRLHKDPTAHAEIVALQKAVKIIANERMAGVSLYVTLEPCAMCAGAIVQARIAELVFGAYDPKAGACGSVLSVIPHAALNHRPVVVKGIEAKKSAQLLQSFFRKRRKEIALLNKARKATS